LAENIPALATLPASFAASNPNLVGLRTMLMQERTALHAKIDGLNARCAGIVGGSAAEASCRTDQAALASALNSHIQESKNFSAAAQASIIRLGDALPPH
jgi:hypothetical protein